jgi:hypothetical protein
MLRDHQPPGAQCSLTLKRRLARESQLGPTPSGAAARYRLLGTGRFTVTVKQCPGDDHYPPMFEDERGQSRNRTMQNARRCGLLFAAAQRTDFGHPLHC